MASNFDIVLHWFWDAFSDCIFSIFTKNWSQNRSQNFDGFAAFGLQGPSPSAVPPRFLIDFAPILGLILVPFSCHLIAFSAPVSTSKPRKLIRRFLKGAAVTLCVYNQLLTSLLVSIFDFFYTELGNLNFVELRFSSHACCNLRGSGGSRIHHKSLIFPSKFQ